MLQPYSVEEDAADSSESELQSENELTVIPGQSPSELAAQTPSVFVENSSDIHIGPHLQYNGPVIVKQYITVNGKEEVKFSSSSFQELSDLNKIANFGLQPQGTGNNENVTFNESNDNLVASLNHKYPKIFYLVGGLILVLLVVVIVTLSIMLSGSEKDTAEYASCPKLESSNVDIKCNFNGNDVLCDKPMAPGTVATLDCKVSYQLTFEPGYNKIICQKNGIWDVPVFKCTQVCGKRNPKAIPLMSHGEVAKIGDFPWHVGIYKSIDGSFEQICGGSLISLNTVVSAAHCFWSEAYGRPMNKDIFRIAAGKYYRDWNVIDTEMQQREISDIIVHENYKGNKLHYSNDIAILKLNISVELTRAVLPVCVDWQNEFERFQLADGKIGTTVGWGITENNEPSKELLTTNLPFVDFATCWRTVPETFQPFLTRDKFCAGYKNGTSVCPGDSGGGLAFENEKKFYLRGIVSAGIEPEGEKRCFTNLYSAFTKVSDFLTWIDKYTR